MPAHWRVLIVMHLRVCRTEKNVLNQKMTGLIVWNWFINLIWRPSKSLPMPENGTDYWGLCERQMKLTYKFVIFSKNTNESFLSINEMKFEMKMPLTTKANTQNAFLVLNDFFFFFFTQYSAQLNHQMRTLKLLLYREKRQNPKLKEGRLNFNSCLYPMTKHCGWVPPWPDYFKQCTLKVNWQMGCDSWFCILGVREQLKNSLTSLQDLNQRLGG